MKLLRRVFVWCLFGGGFVRLGSINDGKFSLQKSAEIFISCTHAWDSGGHTHIACNLAIFFGKLVTCTHYGATYWDNLYS